MPHSRSAKKNLRKSEKRRAQNRAVKKSIKTQIKRVLEVAKTDALDVLRKEYNLAAKRLDKAAARRIVHPNLAARKKSQLAKVVHQKEAAVKT
jgi:small subunit ribosomal protein S20